MNDPAFRAPNDFVGLLIGAERQSLEICFLSLPVIEQWELNEEYRELGEALSEMTALEEADEWRIEPVVYHAASHVAAQLMVHSFPAPRIFNHGAQSVVFNWSNETDNLYLTVSANKISALISSPERITRRIEYSATDLLKPAHLLPFIRAARWGWPVTSITSPDPTVVELVG